MTVLIFANGDISDGEWIRPYLATATAVFAADGGTRHLMALDHPPDLVIGDMDSITAETEAWLVAHNTQFLRFPADKDETDLELALLHAVSAAPADIQVLGAFGGRADQWLANIFLLAHPGLTGRRVELVGQYQHVWLAAPADGVFTIAGAAGDRLSLIPVGGDVRIRRTGGLRWPLNQETLVFGPARGISNEMTAQTAEIEVADGRLICVHIQQDWQR